MKSYIVYRLTRTNVKNPGFSTPIVASTHEFFATYQKAEAHRNKMLKLIEEKGTFRARIVEHVSEISEIENG